MDIEQVRRAAAFAMPLMNPAYPPGPSRFINREYMIITYRTDRAALERVVPAPLQPVDDLVRYEFIRIADSRGCGDYTESWATTTRQPNHVARQLNEEDTKALLARIKADEDAHANAAD
jgi:acetoacetate decarboxylase